MPRTKIFLDTSYVIALVNERDQYYAPAQVLSEQYETADFLVTEAVLLEIGNALCRGLKQGAVEVIQYFLAAEEVEIVPLTTGLLLEGFALYQTYQDKEWSLVDCISFVVMRQQGIQQALTFDHHFDQAGFQRLVVGEGK
ncbi:MAG: PIN domain-containing protein [Leptolyngbyaceae cyanobacterium bins.349]|nr:PIN domain-containing protein [Leptolyngbyaceae cyanobacterium bins.349]